VQPSAKFRGKNEENEKEGAECVGLTDFLKMLTEVVHLNSS